MVVLQLGFGGATGVWLTRGLLDPSATMPWWAAVLANFACACAWGILRAREQRIGEAASIIGDLLRQVDHRDQLIAHARATIQDMSNSITERRL